MDTGLLNPDRLFAPSKAEEQKLRDTIERLERQNDQLQSRNDFLVRRVEDLSLPMHDKLGQLLRAYTMLKEGDTNDGLYELECVMSDIDAAWRSLPA